jgi:hypothetical protein
MFALLNALLDRSRPGLRVARRENRPRLQVERLEDRRLMSVVTNPDNNPIIPNVQVENVFYGSVWSLGSQVSNYQNINGDELAAEAKELNQFFGTITNSSYMDGLSQYTGSNGAPGRGQYLGTDFVAGLNPNVNNPSKWNSITDNQIQNMLQTEMNNHSIPAPDGNKLYVVFLPPGVASTADQGSGGGHHSSFTTTSGVRAYYAVVEHPLSGFLPAGLTNAATRLQQITYVASHELVEAVTDPMVNYQTAWADRNTGNEIGDITQAQPPAGGPMAMEDGYLPSGEGYLVQKYWSELAQTSIAPGGTPFQPLQNLLSLPQLGGRFYLDSEQNGQYVRIDLVLGSLVQGGPTTASYQAFWGQGAASAVATVSLDGSSDTLHITVTESGGNIVFQGTISEPENDWRMTDQMEMSGTVFQSNGAFYAFAAGESTPTYFPGSGYVGPGPANGTGSFTPSSSNLPHRNVLA